MDANGEADDLKLARQLQDDLDRGAQNSISFNCQPETLVTKSAKAPSDPKLDLEPHFDKILGRSTCGECSSKVFRPEANVSLFGINTRDAVLRQCHVACPQCCQILCSGCFQASECDRDCESDASDGCPTVKHCASVRAVLLFEALSALDRLYCPASLRRPIEAGVTKKARSATTSGQGTGYGHGDTRASRDEATQREIKNNQIIANKVDQRRDDLLTDALNIIDGLLPKPESEEAEVYDYVPDPDIRPLILSSSLPELLSELLRNDSMTSISERYKLYQAMLTLLQTVAASDQMVGLLIQRRRIKAFSDGLDVWARGQGDIEWERESDMGNVESGKKRALIASGAESFQDGGHAVVVASSFAHQLSKLLTQARTFARISAAQEALEVEQQKAKGDFGLPITLEDQKAARAAGETLKLAQELIKAGELIEEAVSSHGAEDAEVDGLDGEASVDRRWQEACDRLAFALIDFSDGLSPSTSKVPYQYWNQVTSATVHMAVPNANHLNKEIATLATSLPPGIYLRIDESRRNAIKALVTGPIDTPYADGLFEFDLMLPWDYPATSPTWYVDRLSSTYRSPDAPSVFSTIRTTANGRVRFNPNLYANGKTCLSLLGTWQGRPEENWQPWSSTMLQVFISIQSMIMNDMPYYVGGIDLISPSRSSSLIASPQNEPGYGEPRQSPQNTNYNKNVSLQVVRWAMLDWMTEEKRSSIWADCIKSHFTIRRAKIRQQILTWAGQDERMESYSEATCVQCGTEVTSTKTLLGHASTMNLVEEFDRRCALIDAWPQSSQA